ncbi:MAG: GNAT family N-acetyltransferase [Chloroflexi bacterium]|nr:GNAT family N-acetyltransferase [Chloroflexota bacterium]
MPTIRLATESDIPRLLELYGDLVISTAPGELNRTPTADAYRLAFAEISTAAGHELLVAEEEGKVVGTMALIIVPNLSHGGLPWAGVENVMVDADYRRRGIGKLLMDYALAQAKQAGCYKIQLISDKSRKEAHRFYEALGYKASGHGFRMYL